MLRLISIELRKNLPNRSFQVLLGLYFLLLAGSTSLMDNFKPEVEGVPMDTEMFQFLQFPDVWHNVTYLASWFSILLAVMVILSVSGEYSNRTIRQNLIDGLSRAEFLASKFSTVVILSLVSTLFVFLLNLALGFANTPSLAAVSIFAEAAFIPALFAQTLGYLTMALFFGILIRKSILSAGLFLLYTILIETMMGWILKADLINYLPDHVMDNLIQQPFSRYIGQPFQEEVALMDLGLTFGYTALFLAATYLVLKKRDI